MGGELVPRAISMAREIRRGTAHYTPHQLYAASSGRADVYRHAMREAGYVVPKDTNAAPAVCDVCGYDFEADHPRTDPRPGNRDGWAVGYADLTADEKAAVDWCVGRAKTEGQRHD